MPRSAFGQRIPLRASAPALQSWLRLRLSLSWRRWFGLALGFVLLSGALSAVTLVFLRSQAVSSAERLTTSLAAIIEEQTSRTIQAVDQRLQLATAELSRLEAQGELRRDTARTLLINEAQELPFVRLIWVVDAKGRKTFGAFDQNIGADHGQHEFFQLYQQAPGTQFNFGVAVTAQASGERLLSATRPLRLKTGGFAGLIVATIEPGYFDHIWQAMAIGGEGAIALLRRDGILLMRSPLTEASMGVRLGSVPWDQAPTMPTLSGSYDGVGVIDGVKRIYSYRTLTAQTDLLVRVGQSESEVLAPWRKFSALVIGLWLVASVSVLTLLLALARVWQQRSAAQAQVEQLAERLALATDAAQIGIWDWYPNSDRLLASSTYFKLLGDAPDSGELSYQQFIDRVHPDDRAQVQATVAATSGDAQAGFSFEARVYHANGSVHWISVKGRVLERDETGKATRLLGILSDVTDYRAAQEAKLQVLERLTDAFVALDSNWCFTYVNQKASEILGRQAQTLMGQSIWTEFPAHPAELRRKAYQQAVTSQQAVHFEDFDEHSGRWYENHVYPSDAGLSIYFHDITDRKQAEANLRENEQSLRITLQSIGDGVIATDAEGNITRMNPTAERLTGWTAAQALGLPLSTVFHIVNAKTRLPSVDPVQQVLSNGDVVGLANHTTLLARGGREYQISDSAAPMRSNMGHVIGVVLVFSDITETYRVRESLIATTDLLERTSELAQVGAWEWDVRTQKSTVSREMMRIHDLDPGAPPSSVAQAIARYSPGAQGVIQAAWDAAVHHGTSFDLELPLVTVKGRHLWVRTVGTAVREAGAIVKIRGAVQDVTARRMAEEALRASEASLAQAQARAHLGSWELDLKTQCGTWSAEKYLLHGRDPRLGPPTFAEFLTLIHNDDRPGVVQAYAQAPHCTDPLTVDFRTHPDLGPLRMLSTSIYVLKNEHGTPTRLAGTTLDVTQLKHTEQQLLASQALMAETVQHTQTILNNLMDGVITINAQGLVESINKAACAVFGYGAHEVLGKNVSMLMPEPHHARHDGYLQRYQATKQAHIMGTLTEVQGLRKGGSTFPMSLQLSEILRGEAPTFIGIVRDITQHRQDIEEIRRLAFFDPLTGLPNRRLLVDRLRQAMLTSDRSSHHGALMFLDLDHFKQLNDSQGHDIGDLLLQQVGRRVQDCARAGDSVARLGGDEFVLLLEALSTNEREAASQAEAVANKILQSFTTSFTLRGGIFNATPSIGIVVFRGNQESIDELFKKADLAMYQAKSAGRNSARFYDPAMQAAVAARDAMEQDMREALTSNAFVVHYQIQVNRSGDVTGAEALVRWNHPQHGMVAPNQFIPLAEESGLIRPLGQWVLETACAQLITWAAHPKTAHWTLSVNVSANQFSQPDYVQTVTDALDKTGANPRLLKLELTESMLANDVGDVAEKMRALKSRGVSLSLDDFGTGYSSLAYLKLLPLDQIKIDQTFVRNVLTDASDAAIARAIMALGRSLELQVIAEGVETKGQRDFLAGIGCGAYQGYYFGRPVPASELTLPG